MLYIKYNHIQCIQYKYVISSDIFTTLIPELVKACLQEQHASCFLYVCVCVSFSPCVYNTKPEYIHIPCDIRHLLWMWWTTKALWVWLVWLTTGAEGPSSAKSKKVRRLGNNYGTTPTSFQRNVAKTNKQAEKNIKLTSQGEKGKQSAKPVKRAKK